MVSRGASDSRGGVLTGGILFLCALGGGASLAFELAWLHDLGLVLGSSTEALSYLLACYLLGMALGSWWAGSRFRERAPLRVCARLLLAAGLLGLVLPACWPELGEGLVLFERQGLPLEAARLLLSSLVLLPPTFLMGALFPLWVRGLLQEGDHPPAVARKSAQVCAAQVLGAAAGALLAGYAIIPELGFSACSRLAGLLDLLLAGVLFLLPGRLGNRAEGAAPGAAGVGGRACGAFLLAGFASLGLEVIWTRALIFFMDGLHYAFAAVLATFLLGLGLGGLLVALLARRMTRPEGWLGASQLLAGAGALLSLLLIPLMGGPAAAALADPAGFRLKLLLLAGAFLLLPATLLGTTLPLVTVLTARRGGVEGEGLGRAYGQNTLGNALGALLVPLLLIPALGLRAAWAGMALIQGGAAFLLFSRPAGRLLAAAGMILAGGALAWTLMVPRPLVLASHIFQGRRGPDQRLLSYADGRECSVSVVANDRLGEKILYTDTFAAAATGSAYPYMRLLGHLPVLLCAHPQRVLVLCFGTGTTAGAVSRHAPVELLRVVDVEAQVFQAAPFFQELNHGLPGPVAGVRVESAVRDGRLDLRSTEQPFDVITLEPLLPYTEGAAPFYTREFYELARSRLTTGGCLCQWVPIHALPLTSYRMLLKTFFKVFPQGELYFFEQSSLLVARKGGRPPEAQEFLARARAKPVARSLRKALVESPLDLLAGRVARGVDLLPLLRGDPVMGDDRPQIMFLKVRPASFNEKLVTLGFLEQAWRLGHDGGSQDSLLVAGLVPADRRTLALLSKLRGGLVHARLVESAWMNGQVAPEDRAGPGQDPVLRALSRALITAPNHLEGQQLKRRREAFLAAALARQDLLEGRPFDAWQRLEAVAGAGRDLQREALLGVALSALGDDPEALRTLNRALKKNPRDLLLRVARSSVLGRLHAGRASQQDRLAALARDPAEARRRLTFLEEVRRATPASWNVGAGRRQLEGALVAGVLKTVSLIETARGQLPRGLPPQGRRYLEGHYLRLIENQDAPLSERLLAVRAAGVLGLRSVESSLWALSRGRGPLARTAQAALVALVPHDPRLLRTLWTASKTEERRVLAWMAAERALAPEAVLLLPGLLDDDGDVRLATDRALRRLTRKTVGYDYAAPPLERARQAAAWARLLR